MITKFEPGTYSYGTHHFKTIKITRRTKHRVWFIHPVFEEEKQRKIHQGDGYEYFMPFGSYTLCACVSSEDRVADGLAGE